jgi:hypothetical protein
VNIKVKTVGVAVYLLNARALLHKSQYIWHQYFGRNAQYVESLTFSELSFTYGNADIGQAIFKVGR